MSKENKQPMSKAKKELIVSIVVVVCAILILVAGGITVTIKKNNTWVCGVVMLCCGFAMLVYGIYDSIKHWKIYKKEKEAH